MLIDLHPEDYAAVRRDRGSRAAPNTALVAPILHILAAKFLPTLSGAEQSLLVYLIGSTVCRGQTAREISLHELEHGAVGRRGNKLTQGTGLSRTTLKKVVKTLADSDLIHVYRSKESDGSEHSSRLFEINFNRFLEEDGPEFKLIDAISVAENARKRGSESDQGGSKIDPPYIDIYIRDEVSRDSLSEETSFFIPASPDRAAEQRRQESGMGYVGKKPAPTKGSTSTALAAVAGKYGALVQQSRATAEARYTAASRTEPGMLTKIAMQSLFDSARVAAGLDHRLMVTSREFGLLRKRLKADAPTDFADMVRWVLTHWGTIAHQNRTAVRKDRERLVQAKQLPEAPHFQTFAYWYPYFLKAYRNHLAGRKIENTLAASAGEADRRVKELEGTVATMTRDMAVLRRRITTKPSTPPAAPKSEPSHPTMVRRTTRRIPAATSDADLFGSPDFSEWK